MLAPPKSSTAPKGFINSPLSGGLDLNSSSSGCVRLGSGVVPPLGVVEKFYSSEASLLAGIPLAPSGVAIDEQGSVEIRGRTIRSKALNATDLLSHLLVPFRLHCALLATKSLRRGRPDANAPPPPFPPLSVCRNFAAIPLPAPIDEMNPTWAELSATALAHRLLVATR